MTLSKNQLIAIAVVVVVVIAAAAAAIVMTSETRGGVATLPMAPMLMAQ